MSVCVLAHMYVCMWTRVGRGGIDTGHNSSSAFEVVLQEKSEGIFNRGKNVWMYACIWDVQLEPLASSVLCRSSFFVGKHLGRKPTEKTGSSESLAPPSVSFLPRLIASNKVCSKARCARSVTQGQGSRGKKAEDLPGNEHCEAQSTMNKRIY